MKRYNVENKHERDRGNRDKDVLREEKCALESEKVKYFGTKFKSYKIKYSETGWSVCI